MSLLGGIEAGGTKFVCAVGTGPEQIRAAEFPTTTPSETVARAVEFFRAERPVAIGIGSFGPIDPNPESPKYGYITSTPKRGWRDFDLVGAIRTALNVPVAFDTDVNAAAMGEHRWGAARGVGTFVYLTIGTGIGGGAMVHGRLLHGKVHPEMGHIRVPHDFALDPYRGGCPFHGDCLEGLASGPALEGRWGVRGETLPLEHDAWRLEAHYIALGLATWICTLSPELIILGGGVMARQELLPMIQRKVEALLNGYIEAPPIVAPGLGARAGVLGAIALAAKEVDARAGNVQV